MSDDKDVFNKAEADLRRLTSELQLTPEDLLTVFLLILCNDASVPLPAALSGLTTNYAAFLSPGNGFNDEKLAINTYLGRVGTDLKTFQYVLCNKIAQARAIASIQAAIPSPLPAAPYIPPPPKRPNPPPVGGIGVSLSAPTTATVGQSVTLTATVTVPPGRAITKVEFYEGATLLGQDTTLPYNFSYTPLSAGSKIITARAYDDSPSVVVSVSNAVTISVSAPAVPVPTITVSAPSTANTGENVTLTATASIGGDTIASVQFRVNGANLSSPDTTSPYSTIWTVPGTPGNYTITAIATGTQGGTATSAGVTVVVSVPTTPTPTVAIANTTPKAGLISEAMTLAATASVSGDTLTSVQLRVDGINVGTADTSSPYTASYVGTTKGVKQVSAIALASQGGTATSANYSTQVFDTKALGGGASAEGASLGAVSGDFILFDKNQEAGTSAVSMNLFIANTQVGVFNFFSEVYSGRPFAYYSAADNTLYTGKNIAAGRVDLP